MDTELINRVFKAREERLALQKVVDQMKEAEDADMLTLKNQAIAEGLTEIGTEIAVIKVKPVRNPVVTNWEKLYSFIRERDDFSLLYKSLSKTAVKEYWEEGDEVPGVSAEDDYSISISKVKS
jgi:hypothetical protein